LTQTLGGPGSLNLAPKVLQSGTQEKLELKYKGISQNKHPKYVLSKQVKHVVWHGLHSAGGPENL